MSELVSPNKQRGVVTLDSCVRSYLMDLGVGMERYEQGKHWALECYRELHFDLVQEIKTIQMDLTAWKAAQVPVDYVDFVMLGVVVNNSIRCFTNDNRISLYHPDDDVDGFPDARTGDDSLPVTDTTNSRLWFWGSINQYGEDAGQLYGLTVKGNGQGWYKWNSERREFQFSPAVDGDTKVYMEYISDGINPCESTVVHLYVARLIKLYLHWCRLKYAKSSPLWQIREAKDDYYTEFMKVQGRINKITVEDVLECARDGYRLIGSL